MSDKEIQWTDIIGLEKYYQLSNDGDVKSKTTDELIKKTFEKSGCYTVKLYTIKGKYVTKYIHELVAEHFIDCQNTKNKMVIHKDKNKSNNYYTNLEYVEQSDDLENCHKKASKHIFQYDKDYNLIKEWISMESILNHNPTFKLSAIGNNLCKISHSAFGFVWSYDNNLKKPEKKIISIIDEKYFLTLDIYEYPDDKEYWKDIIGYETRYKISNFSNIYSKQLNILLNKRERGGYCVTKLRDINQKPKMCDVHILVCKHFNPNPNNYKIVHHKDHNKLNNHYTNLEWTTHAGNSQAYHNSKVLPSILQYDIENNLIKEWKDINEILENNKEYKKKSLQDCLNRTCDQRYNYVWKYKDPNANKKKEIDETIYDDEEFRNIGIFDNIDFSLYEVSNYAKVRNTETKKLLRPATCTTGYFQVFLTAKDGTKYNRKVHRLVAFKFVEGYSTTNNFVNHIDENILNNHYKNLEWCTLRQNTIHSTGRKVDQIDIETNKVIKTFDSLADASRLFGKDSQMCIIRVCQHVKKTAYGYKWEYHNIGSSEEHDNDIDTITKNENMIKQYNETKPIDFNLFKLTTS